MKDIIKIRSTGLLALAMGALLFAGCKGHEQKAGDHHAAIAEKADSVIAKEIWTCSMHPEIIRDKPGTCPICGMDLIRKENHAAKVGGIHLDGLLQPTGAFVVSSVPVTAITQQKIS